MNFKREYGLGKCYILTLIMVMVLLGVLGAASGAQGQSANDISGHWAQKQIETWQEQGLIKGYTDGSFRPDNYVTRAEFMAMVNNAFGYTKKAKAAFTDVKADDWFAGEVAKTRAVGYIVGDPDGTIRPNSPISRQEAAVAISRVLKMDTAGITGVKTYKDADSFANWSKAAIVAVSNRGYMTGYPDGSYRPENQITRAEAVTALAKVTGTLYNTAGMFGPETGRQTIKGNVTISKSDVTLKNTIVEGNLYLTEGIGDGHVTLDNVTVNGTTLVSGGGINSIVIINTKLGPVNIEVPDGAKVRLVASGSSEIGAVTSNSNARLEENDLTGEGFVTITIPSLAEVDLLGDFSTVTVIGQEANIRIEGTVNNLTVDSQAQNTVINVAAGSTVANLTLNSATQVTGTGSIEKAILNANGTTVETKPANTITAPGVTGTVGGTTIGNSTAATNPRSSGGGNSGGGNPGSGDPADTTAPSAPTVTGVTEGAIVLGALPLWSDISGVTIAATLNGEPYTKGTSIHVNGSYTLVVTATKTVNSLTASTTVNFTVSNAGTEESPYPILTAEDLKAINGGIIGYDEWGMDKAYQQLADIDLSEYSSGTGWEPIGGSDRGDEFTGSFDGNGFTISNLFIDLPDAEGVGLFGCTDWATLQKLTLTNVNITGGSYVGGITGCAENTNISNCSVIGDIKADGEAGGISGETYYGSISNCYVIGNVNTNGWDAGGLVGYNEGTIEYSYARVNVSGCENVGGIAGYNEGTIDASNYVLGGSITCADNSIAWVEEAYYGRITGYNANDADGTVVADLKLYANPMDEEGRDFSAMEGENGSDAPEDIEFTGWDFADTWRLDDHGSPIFKWQTASPYPVVPFIRGTAYAGTLYYAVPSWSEEAGTTYSAVISIDGGAPQPFVKGVTIDQDGDYSLLVTATKTATGSKTRASVDFTINRDVQLAINGISEGQEFYVQLPKPSWNAGGSYSATLSKDGGAGVPVTSAMLTPDSWEVGSYVLTLSTAQFTYSELHETVSFHVRALGTADNPFMVRDVQDLQDIDNGYPAYGDWGNNGANPFYYELQDDIDLSGIPNWEPLGNGGTFRGNFNGQGKTISGLTIDNSDSAVGLFSKTGNGSVIDNLNLYGLYISGNGDCGGIVGWNLGGTISECTVSGNMSGRGNLGGVVGRNDTGTISNCNSSVNIVSTNDNNNEFGAGSLVGSNNGTIEDSSACGTMTGGYRMGGLVGVAKASSKITGCSAIGAVTATAGTGLGGLIGQNDGMVSTSSAAGNVTGNACIGGLIGINNDTVSGCSAFGTVTGNSAVGQLIGMNNGTVD